MSSLTTKPQPYSRHEELMSRRSFGWFIVAQVLAVIPHVLDLPWWILFVSGLALAWRSAIFFERARWPRHWFISLLGVFMVAMIAIQYRFILSTESAVCGLVVLAQLKWLELRRERDVRVLIILLYALLAVSLLADSGLLRSIYIVLSLYVVVAAQVAQSSDLQVKQVHRTAVSIVMIAIPLTTIMFVFFPRLSPFWGFMMQSNSGRMGMSEQMAPGNITKLTRSNEIAFQVSFADGSPIPSASDLYWRSVVLGEFDGREWSKAPYASGSWGYRGPKPHWARAIEYTGRPYRYTVTVYPHGDKWMFALDVPFVNDDGLELTVAREVRTLDNIDDKRVFEMESYPRAVLDLHLVDRGAIDASSIPGKRNPRSQALARQWYEESGRDVSLLIKRILRFFREEPFYYTLESPALGYDAVDDFIFSSRQGFCEHYASAFASMLRSVGVPVRIVLGYQGGEWNDFGKFMTVRQYDAHAWTEVWIDKQGWVQVDPTAAVAPDRIDLGMAGSLRGSDSIQAGIMHPANFWNFSGLSWLRNSMDYLNHKWTVWVLSYDGERQSALLDWLLGGADWKKLILMGLLVIGAIVLIMFIPAMWQWWLSRERNPLMRRYSRLCARLKRYQVVRPPGESLGCFRERIAQLESLPPGLRQQFIEHSLDVEAFLYH